MTRPPLRELVERVVTSDPVARKVARAARLNERLANLTIPADRILQGNILVPLDMAINGILRAGDTFVSATGVDLALLATRLSDLTANDANLSSRISGRAGTSNRGTLSFFNDTTAVERGMEMAQSVGSATTGTITLAAFQAGTAWTDTQNAFLKITRQQGGTVAGQVYTGGALWGQTGMASQFGTGNFLQIGAGATRTYSHNFGHKPVAWAVMSSANSDGSTPVGVPSANVTIETISDVGFDVKNGNTSARYVRVYLWSDPRKQ